MGNLHLLPARYFQMASCWLAQTKVVILPGFFRIILSGGKTKRFTFFNRFTTVQHAWFILNLRLKRLLSCHFSSDHFTLVGWIFLGGWNPTQFYSGNISCSGWHKDPLINKSGFNGISCQGLNVAVSHLVKLVLPHVLIALAVFFVWVHVAQMEDFFNGKLREKMTPSLFWNSLWQ